MTQIDISFFQKMIEGGLSSIELETNYINKLNVFPVPDGDTGTNMKMTLAGALHDIHGKKFADFKDFGGKFSKALLMNARGNSGVIFSQMMSGFCNNFSSKQLFLTPDDLVNSFKNAKERTYQVVSNPKEGTILTIIRMITESLQAKYADLETLFDDVIRNGDLAIQKTPEFLKELAQAGVVDSGGYGVMSFLKGMNAVLRDELDSYLKGIDSEFIPTDKQIETFHEMGEGGFGYCTEIVLEIGGQINPDEPSHKNKFNPKTFLKNVNAIGNSVVFVHQDNLVKVHVHTMKPYKLLRFAQHYGEFLKIKIDNMTNQFIQNRKEVLHNVQKRKYLPGITIVATVPTVEIAQIFRDNYNVKQTIVTNGENSSVKTFIEKIYLAGTKDVIIVTDDKNLILGANEACNAVKNEVLAEVVPTRNVFESLVAITNFDPDLSQKQNIREMNRALKKVSSGMISTATKDVEYPELMVHQGDKIGIINGEIKISQPDLLATLKGTFDQLLKQSKDSDICYLIYGKSVPKSVVDEFISYADEKGIYCEVQFGNQKTYDFYLGLQ